ncbi:MAG: CBS domain-containing protein [Knoellia sp.]
MLIGELMTTPAEHILSDAPLEDAIAVLGRRRISALPVVDDALRVVGIITEGDILRQSLPEDPRAHLRLTPRLVARDLHVREVMSADPECATARQDSSEVALVLSRRGWKSMPVIDDEGRLLGMVSRSDFLRELSRPDAEVASAVHDAFVTAGHPEWHATVNHGHVVVDSPADGLAAAAVAAAATVPGIRSVEHTERS